MLHIVLIELKRVQGNCCDAHDAEEVSFRIEAQQLIQSKDSLTKILTVGLLFNKGGSMRFLNSIILCVALFCIPILSQAATYELTFSPTSWDFGAIQLGQSATKTFTITNTGTGVATFVSGFPSVPTSYGYNIATTTCAASLVPSASCDVTVTFTPQVSGQRYGALEAYITEYSDSFYSRLSGLGTDGLTHELTFSPTSWDFGAIQLGQSATKTFTITNTGTGVATFVSGFPSVPTSYGYNIATTTCAASLVPSASCDVTVTFTPQVSGQRYGALEAYITEYSDSFYSRLSGLGTEEAAPNPPSITSVTGGNQQITVAFVAGAGPDADSYAATCSSSNGGAAGTATATASPVVVTGLTNGKSYTCTATASNAGGTSSESTASQVVTLTPDAPNPPSVTSVTGGNQQITVAFIAGAGSQADTYAATCASSNGGTSGTATATASPVVVTGLTNGKSYTCTVTASNAGGTSSASTASQVVTLTPDAPNPPTIRSVTAGNQQITVAFVAGAGPAAGSVASVAGDVADSYTATCTSSNGGTDGTATATASPIVVKGLTNGKSYTCTVTASNAGGTSTASSASSTVTPTNVNPQPNPIPTLSEWAKIMMMIMILASIAWSRQRAMGR